MNRSQVTKMLRRGEEYTCHEIVAAVFEYVSERNWPKNDLATMFGEFNDAARATMKTAATRLLGGMSEAEVGFRHGYITTEDGDGARILSSDLIPRQFVDVLSKIPATTSQA